MLPLVVALALTAPAAPSKWVALVHTTSDVPASWKAALQEAAEGNKAGGAFVPPPAVSLDEAQLALGCSGWNKACAGQIAGMTGAAMALVVDVAGKDGVFTLSVQTVKASGQMVGTEEKVDLPVASDKALEFAKEFVKNTPRAPPHGLLILDTDVPGVEVSIDGERKGKTRFEDLVTAGEHTVLLTMEGRAPLTKKVTIKAGAVTTQIETLGAAGPVVDITPTVGVKEHDVVTTTPNAAPAGSPVVGWSLAGVGGVVAAVGLTFGSVTVWDRYLDITPCGAGKKLKCVTATPKLFGLYSTPQREQFGKDASAWIGGSVAAFGVGALLVGTGVAIALSDGEPPAPPPAADAPAPAPTVP